MPARRWGATGRHPVLWGPGKQQGPTPSRGGATRRKLGAVNPLAIDPEVMREMGHRTVDLLVELLGDPDRPALRRASAEEMATRLPFGAPGGTAGLRGAARLG